MRVEQIFFSKFLYELTLLETIIFCVILFFTLMKSPKSKGSKSPVAVQISCLCWYHLKILLKSIKMERHTHLLVHSPNTSWWWWCRIVYMCILFQTNQKKRGYAAWCCIYLKNEHHSHLMIISITMQPAVQCIKEIILHKESP